MNRSAKILTLLLCFSLCAAGAILSAKEDAKSGESKTLTVPVHNHKPPHRNVWLRV